MKLKSVISLILVFAVLSFCGCTEQGTKPIYQSEHFAFTDDMTMYMVSYTRMMMRNEMISEGVDLKKSLADQKRSDGKTWEDYLFEKTAESMKDILLYCEAARSEEYQITEGMSYKASEMVSYLSATADEAGYTAEEYIREVYGENVTLDALEVCTQMMALCESYQITLSDRVEVTETEAEEYANANPDKFLKFNALRFTTKDKEVADKLSSAKDDAEFLQIVGGESGYSLTDTDKNGIPDDIEPKGIVVKTDPAGDFVKAEGREIHDTTVTEKDGEYTVTMVMSLPDKQYDFLWDYRMLYLSTESSSDPEGDLNSLIEQWKDKEGGEEGFANLCARYSDDPSAYYGGLYSDVSLFELPVNFMLWLCDTARVEGDTTVIPSEDGGAYMLYYISGNKQRWLAEATNAIKSEKAEAEIEKARKDIESHFVINDDLLRTIVTDIAAEAMEKEK